MFVNKSGLKKSFGIASISLYCIGLACSCQEMHIDTLRIYNDLIQQRNYAEVYQDKVILSGTSLDYYSNSDVIIYDSVSCIPVWQYNIVFGTDNYAHGEAILSLYAVEDIEINNNLYYSYRLGEESYIARWFNDLSDFSYQSQTRNMQEFLVSYDSVNLEYFANGEYIKFGFTFMCDYNYTNREMEIDINFAWKNIGDENYTYSTLRYLDLVNVDWGQSFQCNYDSVIYDNLSLSSQLNYANQSNVSYQQGVNDVINNPSNYNLYTQAQYLAYGVSKYNEGLDAGGNALSFSGLVNEIFKAPITMFYQVFTNNQAWQWRLPSGEILDIGGLMTFLLTIGIALAIVRLIMKIGGK